MHARTYVCRVSRGTFRTYVVLTFFYVMEVINEIIMSALCRIYVTPGFVYF